MATDSPDFLHLQAQGFAEEPATTQVVDGQHPVHHLMPNYPSSHYCFLVALALFSKSIEDLHDSVLGPILEHYCCCFLFAK